jgi:hypothetical protein
LDADRGGNIGRRLIARTLASADRVSLQNLRGSACHRDDLTFPPFFLRGRRPGKTNQVIGRSPEQGQQDPADPSAAHRLPISAGWNSTAAAKVRTSESASSLPMLDAPGCFGSQRDRNWAADRARIDRQNRARELALQIGIVGGSLRRRTIVGARPPAITSIPRTADCRCNTNHVAELLPGSAKERYSMSVQTTVSSFDRPKLGCRSPFRYS